MWTKCPRVPRDSMRRVTTPNETASTQRAGQWAKSGRSEPESVDTELLSKPEVASGAGFGVASFVRRVSFVRRDVPKGTWSAGFWGSGWNAVLLAVSNRASETDSCRVHGRFGKRKRDSSPRLSEVEWLDWKNFLWKYEVAIARAGRV